MPSLVILGGGPAGNTCASVVATLGADVTLVERDIVGGAAHLWDCIPSTALIAPGGGLVEGDRAQPMGVTAECRLEIGPRGQQGTLWWSGQPVVPSTDAEGASVLGDAFLERGIALLKGARASGVDRDGDVVRVRCEDGRVVEGSHVLLAVGPIP